MNRIFIRYVAAAFLLPLAWTVVPGSAARAGTWETGVLDSEGDAGGYCELTIDGAGALHAVYLRADLSMIKIVSRIGGVWQTPDTVVSAAAGGRCGIAVSQAGEKKVSYFRGDLGALGYAGPEAVDSWTIGPVTSSPSDIGQGNSVSRRSSGEVSASCLNATAGSLLLLIRDEWGAWTPPQTVDPGPSRGSHSDHAYRPGIGYAFSEYDAGQGMILFADPVLRADQWTIGPIASSSDDIGASPSAVLRAGGELSVSCRNATAGSLLLFTRDELGAWSSPQTVDAGPNRGSHSDHAYRPGIGYAFSEYGAAEGMLLFADPVLHARTWEIGTIYTNNSGTFPSAVLAPDGRIASAFYHYDEMVEGRPYFSALNPSGYAAVRAVDDTIGNDATEAVYIDLALTPGWDWHLSYRNGLDNHLWYAFTDTFVIVTGVDDEENPEAAPSALRLHQNYPNPFNPTTVIEYAVPASGTVSLCIYDASGRLVTTLVNKEHRAGTYKATWNGRNEKDARVASGVYFIRLSQKGVTQTKKILVLR